MKTKASLATHYLIGLPLRLGRRGKKICILKEQYAIEVQSLQHFHKI